MNNSIDNPQSGKEGETSNIEEVISSIPVDSPFSLYFEDALKSEFKTMESVSEREFRAMKSKQWEQLSEEGRKPFLDKYNKISAKTKFSSRSVSSDDEYKEDEEYIEPPTKRSKFSKEKSDRAYSENEKPPLYRKRRGRPPKNPGHRVVVHSDRKQTRRGRPRILLNAEEVKFIENFTQEIYEAAIKDRNLNIQKQPAIQKLALLPKLRDTVLNVKTQRLLLKKGILIRFCEWLSPLPDGSLVGNELRKELLGFLNNLPIRTMDLLECEKQYKKEYSQLLEEENILYDNMVGGIGKVVLHLWRREDENEENRKFIEKILEKWYRIISSNKEDFDVGEYDEIDDIGVGIKETRKVKGENENDSDKE